MTKNFKCLEAYNHLKLPEISTCGCSRFKSSSTEKKNDTFKFYFLIFSKVKSQATLMETVY